MIYLDHNTTSPMREEVIAAMTSALRLGGGTTAIHAPGRAARQAVEQARRQVAELARVHPNQVIFTSGGTEANHQAVWGAAAAKGWRGHLVISAVEHPAVLAPCINLAQRGLTISQVKVDANGVCHPESVAAALRPDTILVALLHANNETGVVQPVAEVARVCRQAGVPLHCDAVQSFGKLPVEFAALGCSTLALSGHKLGGPPGVGVLITDPATQLEPLLLGGGQERNRRAGMENLPGIVGLGALCALLATRWTKEADRLLALRNHLEQRLLEQFPELVIFGAAVERLPNACACALPGMDGATLAMNLDLSGIAVSSGSACSSGKVEFSHVLAAMGVPAELGRGLLRFSLGWNNVHSECDQVVEGLGRIVNRLRRLGGMGI